MLFGVVFVLDVFHLFRLWLQIEMYIFIEYSIPSFVVLFN